MKYLLMIWISIFIFLNDRGISQSHCMEHIPISYNSKILKEKVKLEIFLPENHSQLKGRIRPVYVLDGDYVGAVAVANIESLYLNNLSTSCIVIGLTSKNRQWDYTPKADTGTGQYNGSGGADIYLEHLEDELIPFIESKYRTDSSRVLIGHSIGGLLAYYSIIKKPKLFKSIISIDGSLWWNNGKIGKQVMQSLSNPNHFIGEIFECRKDINIPVQFKPNLELLKYLTFQRPPELKYNYMEIKNVNHATVVYPGIYYGLKKILKNKN